MTKPDKKARRADEWTFAMHEGRATHIPTGIEFLMLTNWHAKIDADPKPWVTLELATWGRWTYMGVARLPEDTPDRRQEPTVPVGDANAPGLHAWPILAHAERLEAVLADLVARRGLGDARAEIERIAREAGERWIFRVRLERQRTDGSQRAY